MRKKGLNQYTTEEKVVLFDSMYTKMQDYFKEYKERFHDFDNESWELREDVIGELTSMLFPGHTEEDVFEYLYNGGDFELDKPKSEEIKFTWYSYDWKESMDAIYVTRLQGMVGGKRLLSELDPHGDEYEYCIHSHDVGQEILEKIRDVIYELEGVDDWFNKRYDGNLLVLQGEEELNILLDKINGLDEENLEQVEEEKLDNEDEKYLVVEPYENKIGHMWQIIDKNGFYFDFVLEDFTATPRSTTYLPIYDLAVELVDRHELENTRFLCKPIDFE